MTIQQAIQKAIEGGYVMPEHTLPLGNDSKPDVERYKKAPGKTPTELEIFALHVGYGEGQRAMSVLLDPSFWQSLGKAMGWTPSRMVNRCPVHGESLYQSTDKFCRECGAKNREVLEWEESRIWLDKWKYMIDHLVEGKSIESYFETL